MCTCSTGLRGLITIVLFSTVHCVSVDRLFPHNKTRRRQKCPLGITLYETRPRQLGYLEHDPVGKKIAFA